MPRSLVLIWVLVSIATSAYMYGRHVAYLEAESEGLREIAEVAKRAATAQAELEAKSDDLTELQKKLEEASNADPNHGPSGCIPATGVLRLNQIQ